VAIVTADVSLDGLLLNNRLFRSPVSPTEYAIALGSTFRVVEPTPPAPYGHRNNQIHLFDDLGLYLIEHHKTQLVDAVVFVLWLDEAAFKPKNEYTGDLMIGGVRFFPGTGPEDIADCRVKFKGPSLGLWHATKKGIEIDLRTIGIRQRNGRRGKRLRFIDVSICFD
jgi:hypothetical protein